MFSMKFDVRTAFLNGDLNETIYMKQPKGFENGTNQVCLLRKSIYGLKQSARCWNAKFVDCLKKFDLHPTEADPCVFISKNTTEPLILLIYVDDGAIASKNKNKVYDLLKFLEQNFEITTDSLNVFLGIEINRLSNGSMLINQKSYATKIVEKFNMTNAHNVRIPADPNSLNAIFEKGEENNETNFPYKEAIGSLMFLANVTRPDIAFAVGVLSRYSENLKKIHVTFVKRIFKYIKGTIEYGLMYKKRNDCLKIIVFSDADYASDYITRKSVSGFFVKLDDSVISWGSRKQSTVALSTTESEFIAASTAIQEMIWIKRLMKPLHDDNLPKPILYIDNQSAIQIIKDLRYHCKTKHIDIKYKFIREYYNDGMFTIVCVNTVNQQADILTKALPVKSFEYLRDMINVSK